MIRVSATCCEVCKEALFFGPSDPFDRYVAGGGGWGGIPLVVCLGTWRNLWTRRWYHQACIGVYTDREDRSGRWFIFGLTPSYMEREFECPICRREVPIFAFGLDESANPRLRAEAAERVKYYHWCDVHRVCAKCGQPVHADNLALAVNDDRIDIHERYTDAYQKIDRSDKSCLLIVHNRCPLEVG